MPHSCHAHIAEGLSLLQLFMVGLSGSFSHCSGMCGPLVMAQTYTRLNHIPKSQMSEFKRLQGAALLPYHMGRITTYVMLGILSYLTLNLLTPNIMFKYIAAILLLLASFMFLGSAFSNFNLSANPFKLSLNFQYLAPLRSIVKKTIQNLSQNPTGLRGYMLGIFLGFLPCGLIYAALMSVASTSTSIIDAASGMLAFSLGTIPALFIISYFGSWIINKFRNKMIYIAKLIMIFNALMLAYMAFKVII